MALVPIDPLRDRNPPPPPIITGGDLLSGGSFGVSPSAEQSFIRDATTGGHWARITAGGPNADYAHNGVAPAGDGTATDLFPPYLPQGTIAGTGSGSGATGTATLTGTSVTGVTIGSGGASYTAPSVGFSSGGGSGAAGSAIVSGGVITGVTITSGGTGYTSPPTVTFADNATLLQAPAREINNRTDVPTDGSAIVWLVPDDVRPGWWFSFGGGEGGSWFPVMVMSGDDDGGYVIQKMQLVAGAWTATSDPTVTAYRELTNIRPPTIQPGTMGLARLSPTTASKWELTPWGSDNMFTLKIMVDCIDECSTDPITGNPAIRQTKVFMKLRVSARDLCITTDTI